MVNAPTHQLVATQSFQKRVKNLKLGEVDLNAIYDEYQTNPNCGVVEPGTGGLRKSRFSKGETGKSGGYRVFSFFANRSNPVFLFWIIDKTDDDSLTKEQKVAFKKALSKLKKELKS